MHLQEEDEEEARKERRNLGKAEMVHPKKSEK